MGQNVWGRRGGGEGGKEREQINERSGRNHAWFLERKHAHIWMGVGPYKCVCWGGGGAKQ